MTLEDLVPPLELCKQIPEGEFADSALVWLIKVQEEPEVWERDKTNSIPPIWSKIPAPTLQEIMKELPAYNEKEICLCCIADFPEYGKKRVLGEAWRVGYTERESKLDTNPATAALKLWLRLNKEEEDE